MNRRLYITIIFALLLAWMILPMGTSLAAPLQSQDPSGLRQPVDGPINPAELKAFLDPLMQEQMEAHHIAGAAVSVVQVGKMLLAKGYGLADVAANKKVEAESTLFDIGSISKTFTFTAIMQLVEQGKLDLNADINTYLDFKIPATYPDPITLANLMSHSAGLDEFFYGIAAPSPEEVLPLGEFVRTRLPPRVRPPGVVSAYTNYGVTLAGYIVERVSGQAYTSYVDEHILKPLGMTHTSPHMLLPESSSQDISLTYAYQDGKFQSMKDSLLMLHEIPACCLDTTATDMAQFMIAHLQEGTYQDTRILKPETARLMQTQHFTQDPRLRGWAHGFVEYRAENPRVIGHNGDTDYFYSLIWLVPEADLGIFIASNTAGGRPMIEEVAGAFIDHYFGAPVIVPPVPLENSTTDLHTLEGSYAPANNSIGTSEKLRLVTAILKLQAQEDGSLLLSGLGLSQRYVEVEPMLFQRDDGRRVDMFDRFSFKAGLDGTIQYLLLDTGAFQRLPWYETMGFDLLFSAVVLLFFLSVPVAAIIWRASRQLKEKAAKQVRTERLARWLLGLLVALYFISLGGMFSAFATQAAVLYGTAVAYNVGQFLAIPVTLLAIGAVIFTVLAWRRRFWGLGWRIHYTLVALAAIGVVWWYFNWHIIG